MKVFYDLFCKMEKALLWSVVIFIVIIITLQIIFTANGLEKLAVSAIVDNALPIYMVVIGVVNPLIYFPYYISVGVTRKQFFMGITLSCVVISLCLAILQVPVLIVDGNFLLIKLLGNTLFGIFTFLIGWAFAVGFQFKRGISIIISSAYTTVIIYLCLAVSSLHMPMWPEVLAVAGAIVALGSFLFQAVKRIPLKC